MDYQDYTEEYAVELDLYIDSLNLDSITSLQAAKYAIEFVEKTRNDGIFLRLSGGGPGWAEGTEGAERLRRLGIHTIAIFGCVTNSARDTFTFVYEQITDADKIPWLKEWKFRVVGVCERFNRPFSSEEQRELSEATFSEWEDLYKKEFLNE